MGRHINWTEKDVEKACGRLQVEQDFHARQIYFKARAEERKANRPLQAKARKKTPKGPQKPDVVQRAIQQYTGYEAVREHKFHPTRGWRFDYAITELKIALESDGGIWMEGGGAHSRPKNILRDMEKQNEAQVLGWVNLRFTPQQLNTDAMWRLLDLAIELQKAKNL